MRRPKFGLRWLLLVCLLLVTGQYVALTWLAPRYVMREVERIAGGELSIGGARLSFPLTTTLTNLRLVNNTAESALSIQKAVIRPRWLSVPSRILWVDALEIERPLLRLTRTGSGTMLWPNIPSGLTAESASSLADPLLTTASSWRIHIDAIKIADGVVEFIDEKPALPFHGVLDHVSLVIGPLTIPFESPHLSAVSSGMGQAGMSFAVRGEIVGSGGAAAPIYCSGWLDRAAKDLQASCRLEPLPLAAFEPYYHGPSELRVYTIALNSTSQWWARSNEFTGRLQLELDHLSEGDLSIRGRTIMDFKKITDGREPRLSGEISLTGPLDSPRQWHAEFLPGDNQMQQWVKRLLDRGVEIITFPFLGNRLPISIAPASKATMTDIEAASKEVQEALEILAFPTTEEVLPAATVVRGEPGTLEPESVPGTPITLPERAASPATPAASPESELTVPASVKDRSESRPATPPTSGQPLQAPVQAEPASVP
jgi:hypothetical protein